MNHRGSLWRITTTEERDVKIAEQQAQAERLHRTPSNTPSHTPSRTPGQGFEDAEEFAPGELQASLRDAPEMEGEGEGEGEEDDEGDEPLQ